MHSLVPETYRQLCGADHCEQVKRGVAALFAEPHDIDVLLVYCATSLNWPELLPTIDFAAQYDVALRWDDLTPTITYPAGLQVPDTPEHRAQVQRAYAVAASKQLRFSAFAFADRYPRDAPTAARRIQRCRAPFDTAGIEPNGNVVPCCWNSTCMGNIREKPLRAILDGPGYADIRRCIMAGDPKYCTKCGCEL
jgi:MoaA/NifB/PqqE/SkfB family radical SAM enzyme